MPKISELRLHLLKLFWERYWLLLSSDDRSDRLRRRSPRVYTICYMHG